MLIAYHTEDAADNGSSDRVQAARAASAGELSRLPDYRGPADLLALDIEPDVVAELLRRAGGAPVHRDELSDVLRLLEMEGRH